MPATDTKSPAERRKAALASNRDITAKAAKDADGRPVYSDDDVKAIEANLATIRDAKAEQASAAARAALAEEMESEEVEASASTGRPGPRSVNTPLAGTTDAPLVAREKVLEDPKRGFKHLGDFALAIMDAGPNVHQAIENGSRLKAAAGTGMTQGVTADGGILVPPAFRKEVWDGARQQSESMLGYCDVQSIDPGVQSVEIPAIAETSRATGSRWGGIRSYWKGELTQMTESKPTLRGVKVEPQELYVFSYISDKLLRNAPGLASGLLAKAAADEINFKMGDSVFNGLGNGMPVGVIGHASVVSVAKESGQAAATINATNINKMWARCHANFRSGAVWFINQAVEPQLELLSANVGTGGVPIYLPPGGIADTPNARLKGRPVVVVEYCAALGTVGDIVLGNFGAYLVGLRGMVDQASSMHLKFDYAQTAFRWIFEADGQPWLASKITPFKGSDTLSPFVTLDTRS